jgi:hypothetical protein
MPPPSTHAPQRSAAWALQDTLERIQRHKGVLGVMIVNASGGIEKTTFDVSASAPARL